MRFGKTLLFFLLIGSIFYGPGFTQPVDYQAIDNHALNTPRSEEESLVRLAGYLTTTARNDFEKARAIFRWITHNIAYDVDSYFNHKTSRTNPEKVLKQHKSVCEGYASLFESLGQLANLEVIKIRGYAKGYGYQPGEKFNDTNHSWNVIRIDQKWYLLDATWGAGYANSAKKFVKIFDPYYFLTEPEQFIFSHLPLDSAWQLLENPITLEEFETQVYLRSSFFKLGFSMPAIRERMSSSEFKGFPQSYDLIDKKILLENAPIDKFLPAGYALELRLQAPNALAAAIINAGEWSYMKKEDAQFTGAVVCKTGFLKISLLYPEENGTFITCLEYVVE